MSGRNSPNGEGAPPARPPVRVLVVGGHSLLRAAVRRLCERQADMTAVGEAGGDLKGLRLAVRLGPDVVVLGAGAMRPDGFAPMREILANVPRVRVVVVTAHASPAYREAARREGAADLVSPLGLHQDVIDAVRAAAAR